MPAFHESDRRRGDACIEQVGDCSDRLKGRLWIAARNRIKDVSGHQKLGRVGVGYPLRCRIILAGTPDLVGTADKNPAAVVFPVAEFVGN